MVMNNISTNWKDFYQNSQEDISNQITIIFKYQDETIVISCNYNEKFSEVIKRFYQKSGVNKKGLNFRFCYNAKNICPNLTISESGIINGSKIFVSSTKAIKEEPGDVRQNNDNQNYEAKSDQSQKTIIIRFKTTYNYEIFITVNIEDSLGKVIQRFLQRISKMDLIDRLEKGDNCMVFIYNAEKIKVNDKRKVKDFFKYVNSPTIIVNDLCNLIGA